MSRRGWTRSNDHRGRGGGEGDPTQRRWQYGARDRRAFGVGDRLNADARCGVHCRRRYGSRVNESTRAVSSADIARMSNSLYIFAGSEGERRASKFWVLLILSGVIASAGVLLDSTATVIGAMIVAPLMTPILGTGFALVLADRPNVLRNGGLVLAGALAVIAIGFIMGLGDPLPVVADTNGQVASRVSPGIIDLIAALATGIVGAFAVVRSDVSDTLPGVAIAISLVPPLVVVGLTLESGATDEAFGALLLFLTNVAAIIATSTALLLIYPVRAAAAAAGQHVGQLRGRTLFAVGATVVVIAIPLLFGTLTVIADNLVVRQAQPVVDDWADEAGWFVSDVSYAQGQLRLVVVGTPPTPTEASLRSALDEAGLTDVSAAVTLVLGDRQDVETSPGAAPAS